MYIQIIFIFIRPQSKQTLVYAINALMLQFVRFIFGPYWKKQKSLWIIKEKKNCNIQGEEKKGTIPTFV